MPATTAMLKGRPAREDLRRHTVFRVIFYHLALGADWAAARDSGEYRVSTRGKTLDEVGFLHGSFADQILPVAESFYADLAVPLVLLEIDSDRLADEVRLEEVPGAAKPFPHLYGPLPVTAVTAVRPLVRDAGTGRFVLPEGVG